MLIVLDLSLTRITKLRLLTSQFSIGITNQSEIVGTTTTAQAILATDGSIDSISIIDGGKGYTNLSRTQPYRSRHLELLWITETVGSVIVSGDEVSSISLSNWEWVIPFLQVF